MFEVRWNWRSQEIFGKVAIPPINWTENNNCPIKSYTKINSYESTKFICRNAVVFFLYLLITKATRNFPNYNGSKYSFVHIVLFLCFQKILPRGRVRKTVFSHAIFSGCFCFVLFLYTGKFRLKDFFPCRGWVA